MKRYVLRKKPPGFSLLTPSIESFRFFLCDYFGCSFDLFGCPEDPSFLWGFLRIYGLMILAGIYGFWFDE